MVLFMFALVWLCAALTGNVLVAPITALLLSLLPMGVALLIEATGSVYIFGFSTIMSGNAAINFFGSHIIHVWGAWVNNYYTPSGPPANVTFFTTGLYYTACVIALTVAALFVSLKRRTERTGDSIVFTPVKNALIFIVSVAGMAFISMFWWFGFLSETPPVMLLLVVMVVGFIVSYYIAQMIAEKSFFVFRKVKMLLVCGGIVVVVCSLGLVVFNFGMDWFENRIPERSEIVGVGNLGGGWWNVNERFTDDPEMIDLVIQAHEIIINNKDRLHQTPFSRQSVVNPERWGNSQLIRFVHVSYLLDNGRTISRSYMLDGVTMEETGLREIFSRDILLRTTNLPVFQNPHETSSIEIFYNFMDEQGTWSNQNLHIIGEENIRLATAIIQSAVIEDELRRFNSSFPPFDYEWIYNSRTSAEWDMLRGLGEIHIRFNVFGDPNNNFNFIRDSFSIRGEPAALLVDEIREFAIVMELRN